MKHLLAHLAAGRTLSLEQAVEAFELIMTGQATAAQIAALLALIQSRGPGLDEIAGAATVMRDKATKVAVPAGLTVIDTCGTGGAHSPTFNISTAAALVVAGLGRPRQVAVAKHGNRAVTSRSGSSQVLEALGVKIRVTGQTLTRCLDEAGVCFCFAPAHHPAMKHAAPVRADLGFRTIFNVLGPLTNPAGARRQVMGVFSPDLTAPLASVLQRLGAEHAMVVHGHLPLEKGPVPSGGTGSAGGDSPPVFGAGFGEISITGPTQISHLRAGSVATYEFHPTALGLRYPGADDVLPPLCVSSPADSAATIRKVLSGAQGPARDVVCLNAAAGFTVADLAADLAEGYKLAEESIDSGAAAKALERLAAITQADPTPPT